MRGEENRGDHPAFEYGEQLLQRVKQDYITELDYIHKTYNYFENYRDM
jgi:hypothetical protein